MITREPYYRVVMICFNLSCSFYIIATITWIHHPGETSYTARDDLVSTAKVKSCYHGATECSASCISPASGIVSHSSARRCRHPIAIGGSTHSDRKRANCNDLRLSSMNMGEPPRAATDENWQTRLGGRTWAFNTADLFHWNSYAFSFSSTLSIYNLYIQRKVYIKIDT